MGRVCGGACRDELRLDGLREELEAYKGEEVSMGKGVQWTRLRKMRPSGEAGPWGVLKGRDPSSGRR